MKTKEILIDKQITSAVLTISVDKSLLTGGVAVVVDSLSTYYEVFNYIPSTKGNIIILKFWTYLKCIILLLKSLQSKRLKIVHIHGSSYGSFLRKSIIIFICKVFKKKIVYHIHGAEFKLFYKKYNYFNIVERIIRKVDILIVLSKNWKVFFSDIVDPDKIVILNNMIPKPDLEYKLEKKNVIEFLFLGEIGERKGLFDMIDVIVSHKQDFLDKFILYIGGNGNISKLTDLIEKEDLHQIVKFVGWVSGDKKKELLTSCDVYILPSYNEGLPISILEAMSYGMPIVSTNVGGIPEIVKDQENGFLINPGDKQDLFKRIKFIIDNPQVIDKMGQASKQIVKNYYPENVIPKLEDIYKILLN